MNALADALRLATFYDVSPVIDERLPVFPGHPPVSIETDARTHERDGYFLQRLCLGEHAGSHVDAPSHAVAELADRTIDLYPVERFIAPYVKYDLSTFSPDAGDLVSRAMLETVEERGRFVPEAGDVAIVQFGWDRHLRPSSDDVGERSWWIRNAPGLAADACEYLAERGVSGVGSDTATCDAAMVDGVITSAVGHTKTFLPHEILLFEGLVGLAAAPTRGIFFGLPLRIRGGSGSPIRAVLVGDGSDR
jgi:kynurenine formamidase